MNIKLKALRQKLMLPIGLIIVLTIGAGLSFASRAPVVQAEPLTAGIWQEFDPSVGHQSGEQVYDTTNGLHAWRSDPNALNTFMWYGPYVNLPVGQRYQACFHIRATVPGSKVTLDTVANLGTVTRSSITYQPQNLVDYYQQVCTGPFTVSPGESQYEFRAKVTEGVFRIDKVYLYNR